MPFKKPAQKKDQPVVEAPSRYGSHASMIDEESSDIGQITTGEVCLRDEKGTYWTTTDRLYTGLAEPRRYDSARLIETPNTLLKVVK